MFLRPAKTTFEVPRLRSELGRATMMMVRIYLARSSAMELLLISRLDLIFEQLARNRVFLGDEGLSKLRSSFVIIVGCGGVGSHAAAALARSGVGKIRLIDFDQVTLSSLNRHAVATLADVGTPKVHTIRKRLEAIAPWVHFECRNSLFEAAEAETLLGPLPDGQKPDYVIDAIDNIDSKVDLLYYCAQNGVRVVSSMGAGAKSDPARICVGDISATTDDPLSKSTRVRLRKRGVASGIPAVFSSERSDPRKAKLLPLDEEEFQKGNIDELSVLKNFRVRIMPVLGTMPAIFGLCVANWVMLEITEYPHDTLPPNLRDKAYDTLYGNLVANEERLVRLAGHDATGLKVPLTVKDIGFIMEEIYHGRSAVSGLSTKLTLIRWRKPKPDFFDDSIKGQKRTTLAATELVLLTREEAKKHEEEVLKGGKQPEDVWSTEIVDFVETRLKESAALDRW
jgi:tRNA A37 threonylcarbamoyladenosine dehydratase